MHLLLMFLAIARAEPTCTEAGPVEVCEVSCTEGEAVACVHAAALKLIAGDPAGAKTSWQRACDLGEASACQLVASAAEHVPAEQLPEAQVTGDQVADTAEQACAAGSGAACYTIAQRLPSSSPQAKARLVQACSLGHQLACARLETLANKPLVLPRSASQR